MNPLPDAGQLRSGRRRACHPIAASSTEADNNVEEANLRKTRHTVRLEVLNAV